MKMILSRVEGMDVVTVRDSEKLVESLLVRHARSPVIAQAPFAHEPGPIAGLAEHFGDGHVFRQERIAAAFGETETPGFAVTGLAAGAEVGEYVRLTGGIDNIFDKEYYEHLNRRHKIDRLSLNEVGRSFYLLVKLVK